MTDFNRWLEEVAKYRGAVEKAHGIIPERRVALLQEISPLPHLEGFRQTPVFWLHGDADTIVPPQHSRDFAAALRAKGYPVTYREVAGEKHRDELAQPFQRELAVAANAAPQ